MQKPLFPFIILLAFFTGCDKVTQTEKNLAGEWQIVSYKHMDTEGLLEYAVVNGFIKFEPCTDTSIACPYSISISYDFPSASGTTSENGTYEVIEKGKFMNIQNSNSFDSIIATYRCRILTETKTDLELEFSDAGGNIHTYIFNR
jgi:hypothetical protein